jgi:hypothetical protein
MPAALQHNVKMADDKVSGQGQLTRSKLTAIESAQRPSSRALQMPAKKPINHMRYADLLTP